MVAGREDQMSGFRIGNWPVAMGCGAQGPPTLVRSLALE